MTTDRRAQSVEERLDVVLSGLIQIMGGNLQTRLPVEDLDDPFDAIHSAINTTAEELGQRIQEIEAFRHQQIEALSEYHESVLASMGDALIVVNCDGAVREVNAATCALLGYEKEELVSEQFDRFLVKKEEEQVPFQGTQLEELVLQGVARDMDVRLRSRDGTLIPTTINGSVMRDPQGQIEAIVLVARDITERKQAEEALVRRAAFERLVSEASSGLVGLGTGELDAGIDGALASIGAFSRVDRAYVFLFKDDGARMDNTHEWCADGVEPQIENLKDIRLGEELPWFTERIRNGEVFHVPDVSSLPPEARLEREHFEAQNIQSLVVVPMASGGRLLGFLGFDAVRERRAWTDDDHAVLRLVGESLAHLIERSQAEEALRESESAYRQLADSIGDVFFEMDGDLRYTYWNKASENLTGISAEDAIGKSILDLFPDDENTGRAVAAYREVLRTQQPQTFVSNYWLEGREYFFEISAYPSKRGAAVLVKDITKRKQTEEALRHSEEKYRALFETGFDAMSLIDKATLEILDANPAAVQLYGYSLEQLKKMKAMDLSAEPEKTQDSIRLQDGKAHVPVRQHRKKDGTVFPVEIAASDFELAGRKVNFSAIRDITERKRAEEQVKHLARFPSENPDPVLRVSQDGTVVYCNEAGSSLLSHSNSGQGQPVPEQVCSGMAELLGSGESVVRDVACGDRLCSFVMVPVAGERYVNLYGRDITEHRKLEQQLRQAAKMEAIGQLASGVAHDFNNLLTGILGYANLLKSEMTPGSGAHEACDVIEESAKRAAELTGQLLGFARRGKLRDAPVDMHRIVGETIAILGRTIDRRVTITQRLRADASIVKGDPGQLEQVMLNLAINARDAMPTGGDLVFESAVEELDEEHCRAHAGARPGRYLMVSVADTGLGIPDSHLPRIFEPFFTTKELGQGTGMGLAMVYGIVANHSGHVSVQSEAGLGTTFRVYLPLSGPALPRMDSGRFRAVKGGTAKILVVDDEESVRKVVQAILTPLGYDVAAVCDGKGALDYLDAHPGEVALVILDLTMPVMDGRDCFFTLREKHPGVRVIIASGHAVGGTGQELLEAGALHFVQKPFVRAQLARAVAEALES